MKKLLVMVMLLLSSSAFSAVVPGLIELDEKDSKDMYMALSKWGTRYVDQERRLIRIDILNPRCIWDHKDQHKYPGCTLLDTNHDRELSRSDKPALWLTKLLVRHVGHVCETMNENGTCLTAARLIRCWHPWDPKNPPTLIPIGRRHICWLEPIRAPDAN
ncbi:MAG: hypothetical protein NDI63_12835 [Pseudobdellovibrio sp.]|nr:hypothetical protein [Pseudobdellovibrio sp.]